jgi:hypothetical protein
VSVQPVSSVAAFIARYVAGGAADPVAAEILGGLDGAARLAVDAQAVAASERRTWLRARSGEEWSAARLAHVEQRAFVELRRALQRRGLWHA